MSYWKAQMEAPLLELSAYKRNASLDLSTRLKRFVIETGKRDEFLTWLMKDMGLNEPIDLTSVDALLDALSGKLTPDQVQWLRERADKHRERWEAHASLPRV